MILFYSFAFYKYFVVVVVLVVFVLLVLALLVVHWCFKYCRYNLLPNILSNRNRRRKHTLHSANISEVYISFIVIYVRLFMLTVQP